MSTFFASAIGTVLLVAFLIVLYLLRRQVGPLLRRLGLVALIAAGVAILAIAAFYTLSYLLPPLFQSLPGMPTVSAPSIDWTWWLKAAGLLVVSAVGLALVFIALRWMWRRAGTAGAGGGVPLFSPRVLRGLLLLALAVMVFLVLFSPLGDALLQSEYRYLHPATWPEMIRIKAATWSPQTWSLIILGIAAVILYYLFSSRWWIAAAAAALLLFILPSKIFEGNYEGYRSFSTASGRTANCPGNAEVKVVGSQWVEINPGYRCAVVFDTKRGVSLLGEPHKFVEDSPDVQLGDVLKQNGVRIIYAKAKSSSAEVHYMLCPHGSTSPNKWGC